MRVGPWLAGGVNQRGFLPIHSLTGTRQPTDTENVSISSFIFLMENKLFVYKSNNNSGFTCLAHEDLAKYVVCGKARIPHAAKTMNQMHNLVIYPAGNGGKVNPRSDRSRPRAGDGCRGNRATPARGDISPADGSAVEPLLQIRRGPWAARPQDSHSGPESLLSPATQGETYSPV